MAGEVKNYPGGTPVVVLGSDGTDLHALLADALHRLVVAVATSALPAGAATAANQATMITALQLIDDLRNALDSVGTDELDVNVEGYDPVPSFPIRDTEGAVNVPDTTVITLADYTVTAGKTFYITDIWAADATPAAGVEFRVRLSIAGGYVWRGRGPAGGDVQRSLRTPFVATATQQVILDVYQWSGGALDFEGGILGYEV